jgi:putative SOS response-associated peptidase YedK
MALPGLWENWRSPTGDWVHSFAIVTTTPNELCAELHNRTPVVLKPETWAVWLGEECADASASKLCWRPMTQTLLQRSHDLTGSYSTSFWLSLASSAVSAVTVWRGVPRPSSIV